MFSTASCEPTLPKPTHFKREPSSIINQSSSSNHIDTTGLINNASTSTFDSPALETTSTRISSTIMGEESIAANNFKEIDTNHQDEVSNINTNDIARSPHEIISFRNRIPVKSIRVERDYSLADGITRFSTEYPVELTGKISEDQFRYTITEINKIMDYADRLSWKIVLENLIETLTLYIWPVFFSTHYQRVVEKLLKFIDSENNNAYGPKSLYISDPVKSAFLFIEIRFYD